VGLVVALQRRFDGKEGQVAALDAEIERAQVAERLGEL
jgi:hypothetical protein